MIKTVIFDYRSNQDKSRLDREPIRVDINEDVIPIPNDVYMQQLHEFAKRNPVPKMSRSTQQKIISFVPKRLQTKYPQIFNAALEDVQRDFEKIIAAFSLRRILVSNNNNDSVVDRSFQFKQKGRTENYEVFLQNRRKLKEKLYIVYSFVRFILDTSFRDFPKWLIDLSVYRLSDMQIESNSLTKFENAIAKDLETNLMFLKRNWYPKVMAMLLKSYKRNSSMSKSKWQKILGCVEGLIDRQLMEMKMRTFDRFMWTLKQASAIPMVVFDLKIINCRYDFTPKINVLCEFYQKILSKIANIGSDLLCLEGQIDSRAFTPKAAYLKISVNEVYMAELRRDVDDTLNTVYAPVLECITRLEDSFSALCSPQTQTELNEFFSTTHEITEYLEKIEIYREYSSRAHEIVDKEYLTIAVIRQTAAIHSLKEHASKYVDKFTKCMIANHRTECERLMAWLCQFEERALETPLSTEMLLDNGVYMVKTKQADIEIIENDIQGILNVSIIRRFIGVTADRPARSPYPLSSYKFFHFQFRQVTCSLD